MRNILGGTPIIGVDVILLLGKSTLLIGGAAIPLERVLLILNVETDHINLVENAAIVVKEFYLVAKSILNCRDEMVRMKHWRCNCVTSNVHDWKTKTESFFLLGLIICGVFLCPTRGSYHSVLVRRARDLDTLRGSWDRSGGAVRHRDLVPVQNLRESLVEIT